METYLKPEGCACGKTHRSSVEVLLVGSGVICEIPKQLQRYEAKKPFLLADNNTWEAVGRQVGELLVSSGYSYSSHIFQEKTLEPDEQRVGSAVMHFDHSCDIVIGIGSGVINDIGKILSCISGRKYIIVATAPSMDGYASDTSSMVMDGLKVTVNSRSADVIIGDLDVLKNAPMHMMKSGLGDMLAKYISIAEWRISHLINGEYYCPEVAQLIRSAVQKCVAQAQGLLKRDEKAVQAVFEGLVLGGVAMAYAGMSRPAAGVEHYFSHIWDMRGLEFGTPVDLHGIQCAMGTSLSVKLYEEVKKIQPDFTKAQTYVNGFDYDQWCSVLRQLLGKSAETMIELEAREGKYRKEAHPARFTAIEKNWNAILKILEEELPDSKALSQLLEMLGISEDPSVLDIDRKTLQLSFKATKDIRDKYVLSRLAWDLGILDELSEML